MGEYMEEQMQRLYDQELTCDGVPLHRTYPKSLDELERTAEKPADPKVTTRFRLAEIALPEVIRFANAELPKDFDPQQAAALIAKTVFDIADACIAEAEKRT